MSTPTGGCLRCGKNPICPRLQTAGRADSSSSVSRQRASSSCAPRSSRQGCSNATSLLASTPPHNVIRVRVGDRLVRVQGKFFLGGCRSGWRTRSRGCRQARGRPADQGVRGVQVRDLLRGATRNDRTVPPLASATCSGRGLAPRPGGGARPGFTGRGSSPIPITRYVSDLTTEEARALARALDDAGLKEKTPEAELAYLFEIPGTSVDLPPPSQRRVRNAVFIGFEPYLPHGEWECLPCG